MPVHAYLTFDGNCREAVQFYAQVFQTEAPQIMTYGDAPQDPNYPLPEEAKQLVMHTRLLICGSPVMFSDSFPGMPYAAGTNFSLAVVTNNLDVLRSSFEKLKDGGTVRMELQETFWSKAYGSIVDKFGIEWQFNYEDGQASL
ncbi:VOC family protein [Brevibacillus sp. SAFN-007a]|uniref:VOC family protein n=1 Tax=Brevibacillus sp. SAFN-007a TaxID=3436862 RepID=UPI003F822FB9